MIDYNLLDKLSLEVTKGNVSQSTVGPLSLFKYTQDCHMKGRWNEWNIEARGIIINTVTGKIVCRPMHKFFNLGELTETSIENLPDASYIVYEKLDGSCGSAYLHDGYIRVATPGSMVSDQAEWASAWLNNHLVAIGALNDFKAELTKCTPIFEIIWPDNPGANVVQYGQREELVLLAIRLHNGTEIQPHMVDAFAEKYGFSRPKEFSHILSPTMDETVRDNEEGYVIYWPHNAMRVKIKGGLYKKLHKMLDKISVKGILELIQGKEYRHLHETLSIHAPELAKQADDIAATLRRRFWDLKFLATDWYEQVVVLEKRKLQAEYLHKNAPPEIWCLVFRMLDGSCNYEHIWNVVKREIVKKRT